MQERDPSKVYEHLYKKKERGDDVRSEDVEFERQKAELTF